MHPALRNALFLSCACCGEVDASTPAPALRRRAPHPVSTSSSTRAPRAPPLHSLRDEAWVSGM